MKTFNYYLKTLFFCALLLGSLRTYAQFPEAGAPIFGVPGGVTCGNLDDPDKTIWFKVDGKMVPKPHDQMMNHTTGATPINPGSYVDVNFNISKVNNRYTFVTYTVSPTGERVIYDYQSNHYNTKKPVQGNSNQQLVLVPTCKYEVYFVKGCVIESFTLAPAAAQTASGPVGNPYGSNVLRYAYGGSGECNTCPAIVGSSDCVTFRLLEVIEQTTTTDKELIFSVINNVNTVNNSCGNFPFIGDILFSNITPTHFKNNQPYAFRYNYQLGPAMPQYPAKPNSFVFDQRNNHDILAYDVYQSEIVRFMVSEAEFQRLSNLQPGDPQPEVCAELSNKHPEPHKTIQPLYCAQIDFTDCGPCITTVNDPCFKEDCCFSYDFSANTEGSTPEETLIAFDPITNLCGKTVTSVTFSLPNGYVAGDLDPQSASLATTFTPSVNTSPNPDELVFTANNAGWNAAGEDAAFGFDLPTALLLQPGNNLITVTVNTADGSSFSQTFSATNPECGIVILPVELLSFDGKALNEGIALDWKTATEKDNDHFDIERSVDGRNFEKVGEVKGNGTTSTTKQYAFIDHQPMQALNYYRLRQVDLGGSFEYSKVISVSNKDRLGKPMTLYPNPASEAGFNIKLNTKAPQVSIQIRDITGRLIHSREVKDATEIAIDGKALGMKQGVYLISLKADNEVTVERLIVE